MKQKPKLLKLRKYSPAHTAQRKPNNITMKASKRLAALATVVTLALTVVFVSCNKYNPGEEEVGYGTLTITASSDPTVVNIDTRAANLDVTTYHLTLKSSTKTVYDGTMPAAGKLEHIPAGTYTATLSSSAQAFAVPAFDAPFYSATVNNIVINPGGSTPVDFDCKQTNAGVKFVYDPSLVEEGLAEIVPTVTQGENSLVYADANRTATGYFKAGEAALTLSLNGKPLTVGGAASVPLTLDAREVWTVTLRIDPTSGDAVITADVDTSTEGKDVTVTLDPPTNGGDAPIGAIVLAQDFALCTGPALPVAGAMFNAGANYGSLLSDELVTAAGLDGWDLDVVFSAQGGVRVGLGNAGIGGSGGSITTPALTALGTETATVTVSFLAAAFEPAQGNIKVSVSGGGTVSSPESGLVALPAGTANNEVIAESATMKPYTVVITGATASTRITLATALTNEVNRFLLSDLEVTR